MMHRRLLLSLLLVPAAWPARAGAPWSLISPDEVARDRAAPHKGLTRGLVPLGTPRIEVDRPNTEAELPHPFSVRVRFVPSPGAKIVTSTFKATYGWLAIDITDRLLEHARLSADGLVADDINAPAGQHRVTVSIADTMGRVGERTFRFTIA
jgi:hypothetical protein